MGAYYVASLRHMAVGSGRAYPVGKIDNRVSKALYQRGLGSLGETLEALRIRHWLGAFRYQEKSLG